MKVKNFQFRLDIVTIISPCLAFNNSTYVRT